MDINRDIYRKWLTVIQSRLEHSSSLRVSMDAANFVGTKPFNQSEFQLKGNDNKHSAFFMKEKRLTFLVPLSLFIILLHWIQSILVLQKWLIVQS